MSTNNTPRRFAILLAISFIFCGPTLAPAQQPSKGDDQDEVTAQATAVAVVARKEADQKKEEANKANEKYQEAKKQWEQAVQPTVGQPKLTRDEVDRRRENYDQARTTVTRITDEATQAEKKARRLESEATAYRNRPAGTPAAAVVVSPNPIRQINHQINGPGKVFALAKELDRVLQATKGLPPPAPVGGQYVDPQFVAEPIEIALKRYSDIYEPGPRVTQGNITPKKTTDTPKAKVVKTITDISGSRWVASQWLTYSFEPGGNLRLIQPPGETWQQHGAASWSQSGKNITMRFTKINTWSRERGRIVTDEYTVQAEIVGDRLIGNRQSVMRVPAAGRQPAQVNTSSGTFVAVLEKSAP